MQYLKSLIATLYMLELSGCVATTASTLKYAENTYHGKNVDDLVKDIGAPESKYEMENGDTMYRWIYSGSINLPGTTIYNGSATAYGYGGTATAYGTGTSTTFGGGASNRVCDMTILANSRNIIESIKFKTDTMGTQPMTASMCAQMFGIN